MVKSKFICLVVAVLAFFSSCTNIDYTLGSDLLPDGSKVKLEQMTISGFKPFTITVDSIPTSTWGSAILGSVASPTWGQSNYSFIASYMPNVNVEVSDSVWGVGAVIDSVRFVIQTDSTNSFGDKTQMQQLSVYQLHTPMPYSSDSVYFSNFPVEDYAYLTEPIVRMKLGSSGLFSAEMPNSFAEQFLDTTNGVYLDDSLFISTFPGLYIKTDKSIAGGVAHNIDLSNTGFRVYYHNKNEKPDTASIFYSMYRYQVSDECYVTLIDHDYTLSDPVIGVNDLFLNDSINEQTVSYIQGFGGLVTRMDLNEEYLKNLMDSVNAEGYSAVAISNATLKIPVLDKNPALLDTALVQIGTYLDYQALNLSVDYKAEVDATAEYGSSVTPYNGRLNRLTNTYDIDLTSHVQSLVAGVLDNYTVELAPALSGVKSYRGVKLDCSAIKLELTYVKIE